MLPFAGILAFAPEGPIPYLKKKTLMMGMCDKPKNMN
jgi:hypothetical protein